jgi:hypothetical protein
VALAATATTILFHDKYYFVGFILPFVIFVVGYMGMSIASESFALKAYRDHVDQQIVRLMEGTPGMEKTGPFVPWALTGGRARPAIHEEAVYQSFYALAGVVGGYVGIVVASLYTQEDYWVMTPSLVLFTCLILISIPVMRRTFNTYTEVRALLKSETTRQASAASSGLEPSEKGAS